MKNEVMYEVQKIVMKRINQHTRKVEYKIKWKNYPDDQCTWEPFQNLQYIASMVQQFNRGLESPKEIKNPGKTHQIQKKEKRGRKKKVEEKQAVIKDVPSQEEKDKSNQNGKKSAKKNKQAKKKQIVKQASPPLEQKVEKPSKKMQIESEKNEKPSKKMQIESQKNEKPKVPAFEEEIAQLPQEQSEIVEYASESEEIEENSDDEDEVKIMDVSMDHNGTKYFLVHFTNRIEWLPMDFVRANYPLELVIYYEKFITWTGNKGGVN